MDLINKMISKLSEDTKKKLAELNRKMQKMNDHVSKELDSMKMYQTEIQEIKNSTGRMGNRNVQCEHSVRTIR